MYSQNNEERVILDYFGSYVGRFLDLGANDGVTLSNTRQMALNGWSGVLVDASKECCNRMRQLYKDRNDVKIIHTAISSSRGEVTFYESGTHLKGNDTALVSTIIPSEKTRWEKTGHTYKTYTVPAVPVTELMAFQEFDFINIDLEGMDYEVLSQIDLSDVSCVCVEWNGSQAQKYIDYCAGFGMVEIHRNGENLIFAK